MTKTDARNITTTFSYDALNRVVLRDYSDSTPDVSYFYDGKGLSQTPSNSKGALTKVSSTVSETRHTGFDALGRLTSNQQITDGVTYPISYTYNLAGAMVSETYPSGRVVTNSFDNDGQLSNVSSKATSTATPRTYANSFRYTAHGAVESMRLGNGKFESTQFNTRLQPTQIALGTSANNTSLLKLNYDYGQSDNNGNVKSQTITVSGMSHPLIQTYNYDSLNRLQSATETSNSAQTWKQTYQFDRYGNRRFDTSNNNTTTLPENFDTNVFNPTFNTANNRMSDNQGYEYDSAGNVTKDAANKRFAYDAENKQTSFGTNGSTTNGGTYSYDGDGKRIKKIVGTETTIFVYNASGQMVAEYSTTTPTNPTISYLTSDTLGTPRINTNANGQVTARHDYMPFGEEIASGTGGRTTAQGYGGQDSIRQKFTGYERDAETDLDFAQARYYGLMTGRFMSVDPYNITVESQITAVTNPKKAEAQFVNYLSHPQQWNRYAYVTNNPLKHIDPNGELLELIGSETDIQVGFQRIKELVGKEGAKLLYLRKENGRTYVDYNGSRGDNKNSLDALMQAAPDGINVFLVKIINDKNPANTIQFKVAKEFETKDGKFTTASFGGAATVGKEESLTNHTQIYTHPDAGNITQEKFGSTNAGRMSSSNGRQLDFYNDIVDGHEFGHAYANIYDGTPLNDKSSDPRALEFENYMRSRNGMRNRRIKH